MYKTVVTRRVFQLSPFNSLEVVETMAEIPEHLVNDHKFSNIIHAQQLAEVESQYKRYLKLLRELSNEADQDVYLETFKEFTTNKIKEYLNPTQSKI
jgi:D-ribose pyranose/furanose isomerase RbsD